MISGGSQNLPFCSMVLDIVALNQSNSNNSNMMWRNASVRIKSSTHRVSAALCMLWIYHVSDNGGLFVATQPLETAEIHLERNDAEMHASLIEHTINEAKTIHHNACQPIEHVLYARIDSDPNELKQT